MTVTGYRIDNKLARKAFNGDFEHFPIELVNMQITLNIRREELNECYSRSKYIKRGDFNGLRKMEIIVKKIENIHKDEHLFSKLVIEKDARNNGWYIRGKQYCNSYMQSGTRFAFNEETTNDIIDREKEEEE